MTLVWEYPIVGRANVGWLGTSRGVWKPDPDGLSIDQVDLRVDKVLSTVVVPLSVTVK